MNLYIFGKSTNIGEGFTNLYNKKKTTIKLYTCSRKKNSEIYVDLEKKIYFDLKKKLIKKDFLLINFAPIWKFSKFLNHIFEKDKHLLKNLKGILSISSTSVITRKYSFNDKDRSLSELLNHSENEIGCVAKQLKIPSFIIQPTLIYGTVNGKEDNSLRKIIKIMSKLPAIPLPSSTGMRQPIHAIQLAKLFFKYSEKIIKTKNLIGSKKISVGGDIELNYHQLLVKIKKELPTNHPAKKCKIVLIPWKVILILSFPFLIFYPSYFEYLIRLKINLSGFQKVNNILKERIEDFPVSPM